MKLHYNGKRVSGGGIRVTRIELLRTCSLASSFYGNEKNSTVFVVWIIVVTYQINMADDMFFQASLKIFRQKPFQFLSKHFPISNRSRVNTFWKNVATFEGDRIHPLNLNYHGLKKKKRTQHYNIISFGYEKFRQSLQQSFIGIGGWATGSFHR